jgi:hypothetical protein
MISLAMETPLRQIVLRSNVPRRLLLPTMFNRRAGRVLTEKNERRREARACKKKVGHVSVDQRQ